MYLSQPPVKKARFTIGPSQHDEWSVYNEIGLRFRDILQKLDRLDLEDVRFEDLQITLLDFFQVTEDELAKFEEQGFLACQDMRNASN